MFACFFFSHSTYALTPQIEVARTNSGGIKFVNDGDSSVQPSTSGTLAVGSDTINVNTNCSAGYDIYVSAAANSGTDLTLSGSSASIPANQKIEKSVNPIGSEAALEKDSWGVGKTSSAFAGIQDYSSNIAALTPFYHDNTTDGKDFVFYYGANISNSKAPGKYIGTVLYTVLAKPTCVEYALSFDTSSATSIPNPNAYATKTIGVDETIDLTTISSSSNITKSGYRLIGWRNKNNTSESYGTTGNVDVNPNDTDTITLEPVWEISIYTVTIKTDGKIANCSNTIHPTANVECKMADGKMYQKTQNYAPFNTMFENITNTEGHEATIKSGYCPTGYNITTKAIQENLVRAYGAYEWTDEYGTKMLRTDNSALRNHLGMSGLLWSSTEKDGSFAYVLSPSSSYTLAWHPRYRTDNSHGLCYKNYTPEIVSADTHEYGSIVDISATVDAGFHFDSWVVESPNGLTVADSTAATTSFTMPSNDVVITANLAINNYTITYDANGGTGTVSSQTGDYNQTVTLNSNSFSKSGYTFLGWNHSGSPSDTVYAVNSTQAISELAAKAGVVGNNNGTIKLYAAWKYNGTPTLAGNCNSTIHPTVDTACRMSDGRYWVRGNSGYSIAWTDLCTSSENCKTSTVCPSGYSLPSMSVYNNLLIAYGGSAYGDGGYVLWNSAFDVIGVWASWSSTQGRILNVGNAFAATYSTFPLNYEFAIRCYK